MDIKDILKVRDIFYAVHPLMTTDHDNILTSVEDQLGAFEYIKREVKSLFNVDIQLKHFHDVLSVHKLLEHIKTCDSTWNSPSNVPSSVDVISSKRDEDLNEIPKIDNFELGVIAAACRLPGGVRNTDDFWDSLVNGKNSNKRIPVNRIPTRDHLIRGVKYGAPLEGGHFIDDSDVFGFDHNLFRISKSEAEFIDPQQRLLMECVYECLENAGMLPNSFVRKTDKTAAGEAVASLEDDVIGVFVGLMETEYPHLFKEEAHTGVLSMLGSMASVVAGRISYVFGCTGPTLTVDTACSSSLMALELARQSLKEGRCTKAIVAGVNLILTEMALGHRVNGKMLSEDGICYSFDARASGYGRADGCSVVLVEKVVDSFPYMGVIERINSNHCGRGVSLTAPNAVAHRKLLQGLFDAKLKPQDVSYWEAHGTGTSLGDPIEMNALAEQLGEIPVGSVKASIGHGEAAAGTTSLIKVLLMLKNDYVPPSLHFHVLNKKINHGSLSVPVVGEERTLTRCGISSFGVSGTNVALIVRKADERQDSEEETLTEFYLLLLSGKTKASLKGISKKVQERIGNVNVSLNSIASSLCHRPHFNNFRLALIYDCTGKQIESFRIDRRDDDWQLSFIHISDKLSADILGISKINELFLKQPQERSEEAKLKLALFEFINMFCPTAQIRVMSPKDYVLLMWHQKNLNLPLNMLVDLEKAFTLEEVIQVMKFHNIERVEFPQSFNVKLEEQCAFPISNLRSLHRVFAFSYAHGENDNYEIIYNKPQKPINGLNYCFDRKDVWFEKRNELFDHYLIGRKVAESDKLIIFENQLSTLRHPHIFLNDPANKGLQKDSAIALEMICATVEGRIKNPIHIWDMKIDHFPELSDKMFLKVVMSTDDEEKEWMITATIGSHFFFSCRGEHSANHQVLKERTEIAEIVPFEGIHHEIYLTLISQIWQMGVSDSSDIEIVLHKPLTSTFEIKKFNSITSIAIVTQEDLLLEVFSPKQSLQNILKSEVTEDFHQQDSKMDETSAKLKEEIRKIIIETLTDVLPDASDCELTNSNAGFMDIGLDSLSLIELVNRLNSNSLLTYEVSTSDIFDFPSIDSLNDFLFAKTYKRTEGTCESEEKVQMQPRQLSHGSAEKKEKVLKKLLEALEEVVTEPLSTIDFKCGFMQLGLDSIALVDFINRLNDRYFPDISITTSHLFEFVNLEELAEYYLTKTQSQNEESMAKPSDFRLARKLKPPDDIKGNEMIYNVDEVTSHQNYNGTITFQSGQLIMENYPNESIVNTFERLPSDSLINFDAGQNMMTDAEIFEELCRFSRFLIEKKLKVRLLVQNRSNSKNLIAESFFKTLSAEQFPNIKYIWAERISSFQSKIENCEVIDGYWLITGGLSGVGWACALWLSKFEKVREIHLISRRQSPDSKIFKQIDILKGQGKNIVIHRADVSDFAQMLEVFKKLNKPLRGIIHSAGILRDCRIERQNVQYFADVYKPKVTGFINLDRLVDQFEMNPSTFLVMSSFTSICGNIGQSNYAVVNTIMEQKVRERRERGHKGTTAIAWGNWRETGMASDPNLIQLLEAIGLPGLSTQQAMNSLQVAINSKAERLLIAKINFQKLLSKRKDLPNDILNVYCANRQKLIHNVPVIAFNIFYDDEESFEQEKMRILTGSDGSVQDVVSSRKYVEEVIAKSIKELHYKFDKLTCSMMERIPKRRMVVVFPGQGSQYIGMSRELSAIFPTFRDQFSKNLKMAQRFFEIDLMQVITSKNKAEYLEQTSYGQPLLICFCHALYILWKSVGLSTPDFLLGHSVGELVAGVVAQMITFEQALSIAVSRGKAMEKSKNRGALLAVNIGDVYDLIARYDVQISAWNSRSQTVLAGRMIELEKIANELKSNGNKATFINVTYPFHSSLIENDDLQEFKTFLDSIEFEYSPTGIISCITGETLHKFSTSYLMSHATKPVNFSKCIEKLRAENVNIWLELGPSQLLSSLIQKTLIVDNVADQHVVCSTCSGKSSDCETFIKTALDLEKSGVFIRWNNIFLNNHENVTEERLITWPITETHTIRNEDEQILKCHIVKDEVIIPAAFQLAKIYEWISSIISCSETIELTNIKFSAPWKLTGGKHFTTTLTYSNQIILEVKGQKVTTCWIQYKNKPKSLIDVNLWKDQCTEQLEISNYYKQQAANGTEYGKYFQLLHSMKTGGNKIISKAHVKSSEVWPLIDASFHSVCPLMLTRRPDLIFIPAAISSIHMVLPISQLEQCEVLILSEILEYNEKFIRVNSCVSVDFDGKHNYETVFQGVNEISVMDSALTNINVMTSTTNSQYTNDCSSDQSESWPADENDEPSGSIGIIGYDCMFCHDSNNPEALWDKLISNKVTSNYKYEKRTFETSPTIRENVGLIDSAVHQWEPEFFGISPREAPFVDISQRLLLKIVSRCIERTGLTDVPKKTAILVGLSGCDFEQLAFAESIRRNFEKPNGFYTTGVHRSCAAGRIAHFLGTEGPAITLDTACSSSMSGIWLAYEMLASRRCEMAIVAAANIILTDQVTNSLQNAGMLSNDFYPNCKAFDASANGYKRSEGVACIILTKESFSSSSSVSNEIPWLAKVCSCNLGHNGIASALHVPNGRSQLRVMSVDGDRIIHTNHIECHGSGTALGDVVECRAIAAELQANDSVSVSSIKSFLGHTESVSGLASLITALMQVQNSYRLPQPHVSLVNRQLDSNHLVVNFVGQEANIEKIRVNNFGFSGTIGSFILEKTNRDRHFDDESVSQFYHLAVISAKSVPSLDLYSKAFLKYLKKAEVPVEQICAKLQKGRNHYRYRRCFLMNYKTEILWDSKEEVICSPEDLKEENWTNLKDSEMISFCFTPSFQIYLRNNILTKEAANKFLKELQSDEMKKLNPMLFHRTVGESFVKGNNIEWKKYNSQTFDFSTIKLPTYEFNEKPYWPFTKDCIKNLFYKKKRIAFARKLIHKNDLKKKGKNYKRDVYLISSSSFYFSKVFPTISFEDISRLNKSNLIFEVEASTINEVMKLINIWKVLEPSQGNVLFIVAQSNETKFSEWTGVLRSLASEKIHSFVFISFENVQQIQNEVLNPDIYEAIFYKENERFVERLIEIDTNDISHTFSPKNLLISGAEGGLGKKIQQVLHPQSITKISRRLGNNVAYFSDLENEYDLVCHCAGLVKNATFRKLKPEDFQEIWEAKIGGFEKLESISVRNNCPFVIFSSIASILGSAGQANYSFINGLMTSLAEKSKCQTNVLHLGPCWDVGMLSGSVMAEIRSGVQRRGWNFIESHDIFDKMITKEEEVIIFDGDFNQIVSKQPHLSALLENFVVTLEKDVKDSFMTLPEILQKVSGLTDFHADADTPFMKFGIDSLMMEEIRQLIQTHFKTSLKSSELYQYCTLNKMESFLSSKSLEREPESEECSNKNQTEEESEEVAIIGISGSFSGSEDLEAFWKSLFVEKDCISRGEYPNLPQHVDACGVLPNLEYFDADFFRMSSEEASIYDPQLRHFVQNAYKALDQSGYAQNREKLKIGVYACAEPNEYGRDTAVSEGSLMELFHMNQKDFIAVLTSHLLNLTGPSIGIYSACSSSLTALDLAATCLLSSDMDLALVGAASLVINKNRGYEYEEGNVLSKTGYCSPFIEELADGIVRGSSVGCLVLKRLSKAKKDGDYIWATVKSISVNNDGYDKASFMAPSSIGQTKCIQNALNKLNPLLHPHISYIECHGTATRVGDEIELSALQQTYGNMENSIQIGSVKGNIGHGFAAAGMASIAKCLKMFQTSRIPPHCHLKEDRFLGENNQFLLSKTESRLKKESLIGISSFGIGGTNSHLILQSFTPKLQTTPTNEIIYILPISGKSENSVKRLCAKLIDYFEENIKTLDLSSVAFTLQHRREHHPYRLAITARSITEAIQQLQRLDLKIRKSTHLSEENVAFFFCPQGVLYPGIEKNSREKLPFFSESLENLCQNASALCSTDFLNILTTDQNDMLNQTKYGQIANFILNVSIIKQLNSWLVRGNTFLGHSIGEYSAACCSDVFDEIVGLRILKARGELCQKTSEARMLTVRNLENKCLPKNVEVSAILSESLKCLVGSTESIEALKEIFLKENVDFKELKTNRAFHSSKMKEIEREFEETLRDFEFQSVSNKKFVSSMDGKTKTNLDSNYWIDHLIKPVRLDKSLRAICEDHKIKVMIEIGPSGIVEALINEINPSISVVKTVLSKNQSEKSSTPSQLFQCLADLWSLGYKIDFDKVFGNNSKKSCYLPSYEFDLTHCFREIPQKANRFQFYKTTFSPIREDFDEDYHWKNDGLTIIIEENSQLIAIEDSFKTVSNIFTTEEVLKMNSLNSTALIYFPGSQKLLEPFYLVKHLYEIVINKFELLIISNNNYAHHSICIGPIRENILQGQNNTKFIVNQENLQLSQIIKMLPKTKEHVIFMNSSRSYSLEYSEELEESKLLKEQNIGKTILVLGGNGTIGKKYVEQLLNLSFIQKIIVCGRQHVHFETDRVIFKKVDLLNLDSINNLLNEIWEEIDCIIHLAGQSTSSKLLKNKEEMDIVLNTKIFSTHSILQFLKKKKKKIRKLILISSLSSSLTIQGSADYISSNIYFNFLSFYGFEDVVTNISSIQFPFIGSSKMHSNYEGPLKKFFDLSAINLNSITSLIKYSLTSQFCTAYSPLNPSQLGKVLVEQQLNLSRSTEILENDTETVKHIWKNILSVKEIEETSNFFELGGNSLSALQLIWRINQSLQVKVSSRKLFENPTFRDFLFEVKRCQKRMTSVSNINFVKEAIPLLPSQEHMYFLHQMSKNTEYNLIFCVEFNDFDRINVKALRQSINSIIACQRSYRTIFCRTGSSVTQINLSLTECYQDLRKRILSPIERSNFIEKEKLFKFSLSSPTPPVHITFLSTGRELRILFNQAHILTDGWSMTVLAKNLQNFYEKHVKSMDIPQFHSSLAQYAYENQQRQTYSEDKYLHWIQELQTAKPTEILPNVAESTDNNNNFARIRRLIPPLLWKEVQRIARKHQTTEFVVILTSYLLTVRKHKTDILNDQIMIGCPVSGRNEENQSFIGYFLNNIVVNVNLPVVELEEALKLVETALEKSKLFEDVQYHRLISDVRQNNNNMKNLFNLYFNFRHSLEYPKIDIDGVSPAVKQISLNSIFDLSTTIDEKPKGTEILLEFNASKYTSEEINLFIDDILKRFSNNCSRKNLTMCKTDIPRVSIAQAILNQMKSTGFKTSEEVLNLSVIHELSHRISNNFFVKMGRTVRSDDLISLNFDRNESVSYILSILLTGAGYVPIDNSWPPERQERIRQNIHCDLILKKKTNEHLLKYSKKVLLMNRNHPDDVMYVIHTSGSTATPKGVVVEHQNVMSFVTSSIRQILLNPTSIVLNSVNTVFDVSVSNIFVSLLASATLAFQKCPMSFLNEITKNKCSYCFLPSAVFNQIPTHQLNSLKPLEKLAIGGESINEHKLQQVLNSNIDVLQIYGPTETTVWSLTKRCKVEKCSGILIGQSNSNEFCQISSDRLLYGELIISGTKVARGYILGDKSSQSFNGQYLTSDFVYKWKSNYYFCGRLDDQVKLRGQLVNFHHIEEAIMKYCNMDFVYVTTIDSQLVAFISKLDDCARQKLSSQLPPYMVPNYFIEVSHLKINTSGKIDRKKLREIFEGFKKKKEEVVPKNNFMKSWIEMSVKEIFQQLTGKEAINEEEDDFFSLGGHSLLLMEMQTRIERIFEVKMEISQIYEALTIRKISKIIASHQYEMSDEKQTLIPITTIRESSNDNMNIYFIHPVGGSILPYYAFLNILPANRYNLYAIEYQLHYKAQSLKELSASYALSNKIPYLVGHSLGGIICREMVCDIKLYTDYEISQVIMLDSWAIDERRFSVEKVKTFAEKVFKNLPDFDVRVKKAVRLAEMLKKHKNTLSTTDIKLFKAEKLEDASFRLAVRSELDEEGARSMIANGLEKYCQGKIYSYLLPGDHESCMKLHNLKHRKQEIEQIFKDLPVWK